MSNEVAFVVKNISKTFKLPHEKQNSIKGTLVNFAKRKKGYETQHVLKDISFEIQKGEFFGIVGRNGSGKSTLLKLMAGIYTPDHGTITVNGSLTPFIELGVGFNPELSGRENVFLNGALLGFNRLEIAEMYDDIVKFAEIERFMDQKLKNYSSGMQVRLAFSIATHANSDILIFDEVLAVGDAKFQQKCLDVFRDLKQRGKTIILVSHSTADIEKFCDKVLVVDKSESLGVMEPKEAIALYERLNVDDSQKSENKKRWGNGEIKIDKVFVQSNSKKTKVINFGDSISINLELSRKDSLEDMPFVAGIGIYDTDNNSILGPNSSAESLIFPKGKQKIKVTYYIDSFILNQGKYSITAAILDQYSEKSFDHIVDVHNFTVVDQELRYGKVSLPNTAWKVEA